MADAIMKAFVQFRADDSGLRQDAEAKVKAATDRLTGTAKITLDTTQVDRQRAGLQAKLSALGARATQIRIGADDKDSLAKIAALQVRLTALDKRVTSPKISVEGAARAEAQILAIDAQLSRMDKTAQASRGGITGLIGEITGFGNAATAASGRSGTFARSLAAVNLATGVLEPAMAGVIVAAGGLTAAFAAAGIGLGVFGAVASSAMTTASTAADKAAAAQAAYTSAVARANLAYRQALAGATTAQQRHAAEVARTNALQSAALTRTQALSQAYDGMSRSQVELSRQITAAKTAWQQFVAANTAGVSSIMSSGLGLLPRLLEMMQPFMAPVENALRGIISQLAGAIAPGTQLSRIMTDLARASGPLLRDALTSAGNILVGILGVIRAFLPEGMKLSAWIVDATARFREWGMTLQSHTGFQSLMTMFREQTPQAMEILRNLGQVILNIGRAMTGLSTFGNSKMLLNALLPLSGLLKDLSENRALVNIALYLVAIGSAAVKLGPAFTAASAGARALAGALGLASATPVVLVAAAVIALGVAFYEAWKRSAGFRDAIKTIGQVFLQIGIIVVQANKVIVDSFLSMVGSVLHGAATAFGWVPGLGDKLRGASRAFDSFKAGVDRSFDGVIAKMQEWQGQLDKSRSTASADIGVIVTAFQNQARASDTAKAALDRYTSAVTANGAGSAAAKSARDALIADLVRAGVSAGTARADVAAYTTAITANGASSTAAAAARQKLVSDILAASTNARQGRADLDNYNTAVIRNGTDSDSARAARQKLIDDLKNSGMSAQAAGKLVDGLGSNIRALPGSKSMKLIMDGKGTYSLSEINAATGKQQEAATGGRIWRGQVRRYDAGGRIRGPGGPRSDLAGLFALSDREWVIQASSAEKYGEAAMAALNAGKAAIVHGPGVAGMASGGPVRAMADGGLVTTGNLLAGNYPGKMYADFQATFTAAMVKAMREAIKKAMESGGKGSAAIVADALSWVGKIPYVWGGTSLTSGADCSGFTMAIYGRHGISAPRTSEAQGAWVKRTGPVPGGLAFYDSPAGGPPPGHVAIVRSASQVISQGGGMGPQLQGLGSPMWTGIPPGGFARGGRVSRYDTGGWLPPGLSASWNGTGMPEKVLPPGDDGGGRQVTGRLDRVAALLERLIDTTAAVPARTGQHVGAAVNSTAQAAAFRSRYPAGGVRLSRLPGPAAQGIAKSRLCNAQAAGDADLAFPGCISLPGLLDQLRGELGGMVRGTGPAVAFLVDRDGTGQPCPCIT